MTELQEDFRRFKARADSAAATMAENATAAQGQASAAQLWKELRDLRPYGGEFPSSTDGVITWDATHIMKGEDIFSLELVAR